MEWWNEFLCATLITLCLFSTHYRCGSRMQLEILDLFGECCFHFEIYINDKQLFINTILTIHLPLPYSTLSHLQYITYIIAVLSITISRLHRNSWNFFSDLNSLVLLGLIRLMWPTNVAISGNTKKIIITRSWNNQKLIEFVFLKSKAIFCALFLLMIINS